MMIIENALEGEEVGQAPAIDLAALNAANVTIDHLTTARGALTQLAGDLRWVQMARRNQLKSAFGDVAIIEAVDNRLLALRKWEDLNDPERSLSQRHLMEAATLASLIETDHGIGFDDTRFGEIVEFLAEMPW
jgi:hypothetical protein